MVDNVKGFIEISKECCGQEDPSSSGMDPRLGMLTESDDSSLPAFDWIPGHKGNEHQRRNLTVENRICLGDVIKGCCLSPVVLRTHGSQSVALPRKVLGAPTRGAVVFREDISQAEEWPAALSATIAAALGGPWTFRSLSRSYHRATDLALVQLNFDWVHLITYLIKQHSQPPKAVLKRCLTRESGKAVPTCKQKLPALSYHEAISVFVATGI